MIFEKTNLDKCFVITPKEIKDERGGFMRVFCENIFKDQGCEMKFVQINHSFNFKKGTLRGMHFQYFTSSESKLVRCIKGSIFDVVVDLRKNSKTFLKHFYVELSESNKKMILIPEGFAHGFQTLTDNTEVIYHHSNFYNPEFEGGIRFDDIKLGVNWPLIVSEISDRDRKHQPLDNNFIGI